MNEVTVTDKSSKNINTACWIIWILTFVLMAVPFIPTFWLWIPLWIAGVICTIIAFVKARYTTGVIGIIWSLVGTPIWWFLSGFISVLIFGAAGGTAVDEDTINDPIIENIENNPIEKNNF